jgi:hypothetical protein
VRVLFVSTYELGHQPSSVATLAAVAAAAGHEVRACDVAVSELSGEDVAWAEAAVLSVPMHTALRLALGVVERLRADRPGLPVALCGLYAPVATGHRLLGPGDLLAAGDAAGPLVGWLEGSVPGGSIVELGAVHLEPGPLPLRSALPPLASYARLVSGGGRFLAGSTATSTGCNHRCRHCPVAAVYRGRSRVVPEEAVLADVEQLVAAGARHVSFSDPDFLNRPRHGLAVARAVHSSWPELTFDATVKVEHVIRHEALWPELAGLGLLFVVSAFESLDDSVLALLHKGHTAADEASALGILRRSGIETRPSWLPFTPWTTPEALGSILSFTAEQDLVFSTDAVQFSIRLLLPRGSLLLESPDPVLAAAVAAVGSASPTRPLFSPDEETGSVSWCSPDPRLDELALELARVAEHSAELEMDPAEAFTLVWETARSFGVPLPAEIPPPVVAPLTRGVRPRMSEAWFCCAEPTSAQLVAAGRSPARDL